MQGLGVYITKCIVGMCRVGKFTNIRVLCGNAALGSLHYLVCCVDWQGWESLYILSVYKLHLFLRNHVQNVLNDKMDAYHEYQDHRANKCVYNTMGNR